MAQQWLCEQGCVPLLRACPCAGSGQGCSRAVTSTGLRAVEQEPDLLCRRDLFFHRLREEAKPAALSFLRIACEGSPSQHVPWEGTRGGVSIWGADGWWLPGCRKLRVCSSSVIPVVAGVCFSLGSPPVSLIPQPALPHLRGLILPLGGRGWSGHAEPLISNPQKEWNKSLHVGRLLVFSKSKPGASGGGILLICFVSFLD